MKRPHPALPSPQLPRGHAALLVAVLWGVLAGCATPAPQPEGADLYEVTPEDVAPRDQAALEQAALEAYRAADWEGAAEGFLALSRAQPGNPLHLYNVACAFGRLERPGQSAAFLEAAWDAGFHNLEQARRDPDLDPVRGAPVFEDMMRSLEARAAQRAARLGHAIPVVAPASLDARVLLPEGPAPDAGWPVVVALHGFGHSAEGFAERLGIDARRALWVLPQGPYEAGPGFSWFRLRQGDMTPLQPSRDLSEDYILTALAAVRAHWSVDPSRVVVVGFSQGGLLAASLSLRHPDVFSAAVAVGGWIVPEEQPPEVLARAARAGVRVTLLHSPEDEGVPFARAEAAARLLDAAGVPHALVRYPGGHVLPPEVVDHVRRALEEAGAPR